MRIADIVFRQGHLSDDALIEAVLNEGRHAHLDTCSRCSERAVELQRWLDEAQAMAADEADEMFPPEKLARQQAHILRRLEQLDEPARIIAFPSQAMPASRPDTGRRVAPGWLGVAAAAGLVIGLVGGRFVTEPSPATPAQSQQAPLTVPQGNEPVNASLLDYDFDRQVPDALMAIDQLTPTPVSYNTPPAR